MSIMPNQSNLRTPQASRSDQPSASRALQLFEPSPDAVYTIEATAHLVDLPRRTILVYCKHGLVSPARAKTGSGYYFDRDAIRALRRIDSLRSVCGDDLPGIKIILDLTSELERLHSEVRSLRNGIETQESKMQYMRRYV
jgi:DNA-binding transcriptional MerR regulator